MSIGRKILICGHGELLEHCHKCEIEQLKKERDKLQEIVSQYEKGFKGVCHACEHTADINIQLQKERDILLDAVRFYSLDGQKELGYTALDNGKKARQALKEIGEE